MTQNTQPKRIPVEKLRQNRLFVAAPMYGGQCDGIFMKSCVDIATLFTKHSIDVIWWILMNESLITRARNYCCDEFLRSPAQHLLFIDSDIGFSAHDVVHLMHLQSEDPEKYPIIGGPYCKKTIAWEKIKKAVDMGVADEDPNVLNEFVGDFVFNPVSGAQSMPINEPAEVLELGTGFMMIHRSALEKFQAAYPQYMYRPDHVRTKEFDGSREIMQFFQAEIEPVHKRYLSEDYWFTQKAREIGLKTWLCPWMRLQHAGKNVYAGSLAALAQIGAHATADQAEMNRIKKTQNEKVNK